MKRARIVDAGVTAPDGAGDGAYSLIGVTGSTDDVARAIADALRQGGITGRDGDEPIVTFTLSIVVVAGDAADLDHDPAAAGTGAACAPFTAGGRPCPICDPALAAEGLEVSIERAPDGATVVSIEGAPDDDPDCLRVRVYLNDARARWIGIDDPAYQLATCGRCGREYPIGGACDGPGYHP